VLGTYHTEVLNKPSQLILKVLLSSAVIVTVRRVLFKKFSYALLKTYNKYVSKLIF